LKNGWRNIEKSKAFAPSAKNELDAGKAMVPKTNRKYSPGKDSFKEGVKKKNNLKFVQGGPRRRVPEAETTKALIQKGQGYYAT